MLAAAVRRGLRTPLLVGDMPFGSYEQSDEQAIANAQRFVKEAGCDAVKLERGGSSVDRARAIVRAGIPVMGHVGLTPQTATALGGFKAQGKTAGQAVEDRRGGPGAAGGGLLRDRLRGDPGGSHRGADAADDDPGDRDRRRRARPTARCSSSTTCSASSAATRRSSSSATPSVREQMIDGVAAYAGEVRSRAFPGPSTPTRRPGRAGGVPALPRAGARRAARRSAATGRRRRSELVARCSSLGLEAEVFSDGWS